MNRSRIIYVIIALCAVFLLSCENHESVLPAAEGSPSVSQTKFGVQGVVVTSGGTYCFRGVVSKSDGGFADGAKVQLKQNDINYGNAVICGEDGSFNS